MIRIFTLLGCLQIFLAAFAIAAPSHHLVGWSNLVLPGAGQLLLGEPLRAAGELALSGGAFTAGYLISDPGPMTLDGVPNSLPKFGVNTRRNTDEANITKPMYAEMLQELGIKSHMSFLFLSYREAAKNLGITEKIDQSPVNELFLSPFKTKYLFDPWVYIPILATAAMTIVDFHVTKNNGLPVIPRLTPYSNFLYALDYQVVQPFGSGAPEEMFYRGFLQREMHSIVDSPFFSIPLSTAAFAFSHGPGAGRITAAIAGAYLGYLSHRNDGDLKPGITVHFWSSLILGIETVFLSHDAQRTTPPTALHVQINY